MRNALIIYAAVIIVVSWLIGFAIYSLPEESKSSAGALFLLIPVITFAMAYVGHKLSGAVGNPFKGLTWGSTSWYFMVWILGILAGGAVVVLSMGIGLVGFDPEMGDYVAMVIEQTEASGQPLPSGAESSYKIVGYATAGIAPTFGAWIGGAFAALISLSWLGWFGRRLMVHGIPTMIGILMGLGLISSAAAGMMDNPQVGDLGLIERIIVMGLSGACFTPLTVWLFLKNRSVVIPALAQTSYQAAFGAFTPFLSDANQLFGPPSGIIVSVCVLAAGIGLWVLKDPGGRDMAIAAVAHDGTPLNPEQLASLDAEGQIDAPEPVDQAESDEGTHS